MHVEGDTPATEPDTNPTDLTADALSALDAGIAAADTDAPPATEAVPADPAPAADAGTPPADDPAAAPPADGQPAAQPEGEPPADAHPPAAEAQPDADTEAEIASLGLKDKTAERFRTLAGEVKELAPIRDALKAAGIEDVARLPELVQRSKVGEEMVQMVFETGASSEQYGAALDYLGLIAKAQHGDMAAAGQAYDVMSKELAVLAQMLGKEVPGVHDPLAAHRDLLAEVETGDLTRARAVEIAGQRDRSKYADSVKTQQQEAQGAAARAEQQGIDWLKRFDAEMAQEDPSYAAKRPQLNDAVRHIRETYHPSEWAQRTALAYARIQAPAVAAPPAAPAAPAQPRPGPMRPSGPRPAMDPTSFKNPMDALEYGIEQANQA